MVLTKNGGVITNGDSLEWDPSIESRDIQVIISMS